jgi:agmatinase
MSGHDQGGIPHLAAPWYSGSPSFLRAPWVEPSAVPAGDVAIVGMPVGEYVLTGGRAGSRFGPRAIRTASLRQATYYGVQTDPEGALDFRTGRSTTWPKRMPMVDTGDVTLFPNDIPAQIEAAAEHIRDASRTSGLTVTLGGDHFVAYPSFEGVIRAWRDRKPGLKVGYLHIDSHTDFADRHHFHGRYNHGTAARRISELPEVTKMAWFGINIASSPSQYRVMAERKFLVHTTFYSHRVGVANSLRELLEYVRDGVDILYVSIDIDVLDAAYAPGTGFAIFEGLTSSEFLEAMRVLRDVDELVGLDVCEVDPEIDPSGRTAVLAANSVMAIVSNRVFDSTTPIPLDQLHKVFHV